MHINMKGCKENQLCLTSLFLDMKSPIFSQKMSVNPECERVFSLRKQPMWQDVVQQRAAESPLSLFLSQSTENSHKCP